MKLTADNIEEEIWRTIKEAPPAIFAEKSVIVINPTSHALLMQIIKAHQPKYTDTVNIKYNGATIKVREDMPDDTIIICRLADYDSM